MYDTPIVHSLEALYGFSHHPSLLTSTLAAWAVIFEGAIPTLAALKMSDAAAIASPIDLSAFMTSSLFLSLLTKKEIPNRVGQRSAGATILNVHVHPDGDDDDEAEDRLLNRRGHVEHD